MTFFKNSNGSVKTFFNKNLVMPMRYAAFTLAEVLITLGIIGVVAAMVIPIVMQNAQNQEYNSGVKKAQSEFSQAISSIIQTNGGYFDFLNSSSSDLRDAFCKVMRCVKTGDAVDIFSRSSGNYRYYKGERSDWPIDYGYDQAAAALSDGTLFAFETFGLNNINVQHYYNPGPDLWIVADISVDINGQKGPNMLGMDFYRFWIKTNSSGTGDFTIVPTGIPGDGWMARCLVNMSNWYYNSCTYFRLIKPDQLP